MPIQITHAVIHGFEKLQHSHEIVSVTKKDVVLDIETLPVVRLVQSIASLLGRRQNAQSWGRFDSPDRAGPYRQRLLEHANNPRDANSFVAISHSAMDEIVTKEGLNNSVSGMLPA